MDIRSELSRRRFVKMLSFGTASSVVAGKLWRRDLLAFCVNTSTQKDAVLKVRVSDYPALQQNYGSVRLGVNPIFGPGGPDGDFWPFMINKDGFGDFYVLDCECRHASCVVPAFDSQSFRITCSCHGSEYDINGAVLNGPATQPLHRYPCEFDGNDTLTIRAPCWGFDVSLAVQPGGPKARLKLEFPTFRNVTYEVNFREKPSDAWSVASFSTTPTGPANQTEWLADGLPATVYVDRATATGFYAVGMKLAEM
jgi:nitrite reductase/ring-hydroxylating ferredoxin subunit